MPRPLVATVAVSAFCAYFLAWGYGVFDVEFGDVFSSRLAYWGVFVGVPVSSSALPLAAGLHRSSAWCFWPCQPCPSAA